jgi:hypothetical protein
MSMSGIGRVNLVRAARVALLASVLLVLVMPAAHAAATRLWVKRYDNGDIDEAAAIAFDAYGNVYVAGRSHGGATGEDFLLIKYAAGGGVKWMRRYDRTSLWDGARGVAVDGNGNVYVTGRSFGPGSHGDFATIKYDAAGNQKWVKRYTSSGYNDDGAMDIALDSNGNVIVTGFTTTKGQGFDYLTIKYSPSGTAIFTKGYNGPGDAADIARGVAVDSMNNVYVTGVSMGNGTDSDMCTIKYSPAGVQEWVRRWDSPIHKSDGAMDIAIDDYDFPYVTGYTYRWANNSDYMTIKYNRNGTWKWSKRYNGPANAPDVAYAIAIDGNGIYVTGGSFGKGTDFDYATIRYFRGGTITTFVRRYSGPARKADIANALVAANNMVYVTGFSTGGATSGDYFTIAYGGGGGFKWANRYNGNGNDFDQGNAIGINPANGNVIVTGGSRGVGSKSDFLTIAYTP